MLCVLGMSGCGLLPQESSRAEPASRPASSRSAKVPTTLRVPPDRVPPPGRCAIWYPGLRTDRQPPPMSCNKAHADAESYGGVVIWQESARGRASGEVAFVRYGPHKLGGIPADRLPPPGRCRLWIDGIPDHLQPAPDVCAKVEARQRQGGGRLLYMPASDLKSAASPAAPKP